MVGVLVAVSVERWWISFVASVAFATQQIRGAATVPNFAASDLPLSSLACAALCWLAIRDSLVAGCRVAAFLYGTRRLIIKMSVAVLLSAMGRWDNC
jgi:hypothetical protein